MIYAMALIGLTIVLQARPVYLFFMSHFRDFPLSGWFYLETSVAVLIIVFVNAAAVVLPIKYGLRHLEHMEAIE